MSLRSKLEAVIYAAEEPVTLAQLAGLFADEALEWKAEQQAAAAEAKAADQPTTLPMIDEGLEYLGLEQTPQFYAAQTEPTGELPADEVAEVPPAEAGPRVMRRQLKSRGARANPMPSVPLASAIGK